MVGLERTLLGRGGDFSRLPSWDRAVGVKRPRSYERGCTDAIRAALGFCSEGWQIAHAYGEWASLIRGLRKIALAWAMHSLIYEDDTIKFAATRSADCERGFAGGVAVAGGFGPE